MADPEQDAPTRAALDLDSDSGPIPGLSADDRVGTIPYIYYRPHFVDDAEEEALLRAIQTAPRTKWKVLTRRRLQEWGGTVHPKAMIKEDLPSWMDGVNASLADDVCVWEGKAPNHWLVNEYEAGQGIDAHMDGPLYMPSVAIVSLGAAVVMDFYHLDADTKVRSYAESILLEPQSLLVFCGDLYELKLHSIAERTHDAILPSLINYHLLDHDSIAAAATTVADLVAAAESGDGDATADGLVGGVTVDPRWELPAALRAVEASNVGSDGDDDDAVDADRQVLADDVLILPRGTRTSCTIRVVKKVLRNLLRF